MFSKKVLKTILTFLLVIACAAVSPAQTSQAAEKSYTDNDLKYMAAIIYCEAGNQCYAGKIAVGCVVMNRVKSSRETKNVERGKYSSGARRECMKAAQEVLEGQRMVTYKGRKMSMKKYHFFSQRLSSPKLRISGHQFK